MLSSAGFSTPRGPFAGAAPLAHRPLSAIAATIAGGVPQGRIQRIIAELIPELEALHRAGRICGDISVHSVGLDESGRAHLMALSAENGPSPRPRTLTPGYAPFELYTESPDWPRGPWTDVYALSAVAYSLVAGQQPPPAAERRVADTHQPLQTLGLSKYSDTFLRAIDAGLAINPADRPQTMQAYAELLALPRLVQPLEPAAETVVPLPSSAQADASGPARGLSLRTVIQAVLLGIATLGVAVYWWGRLSGGPEPVITHSELAVSGSDAKTTSSAAQPAPGPQSQSVESGERVLVSEPSNAESRLRIAQPPDLAPTFLVRSSEEEGDESNTTTTASVTPPAPVETTVKPERKAPAPVRVSINVRPWGEILIDGVSHGVTPPLKTVMLRPGKYAVTIRNSAQPPYNTTLVVTAGKPAVITHLFR
ncbi:hypothetical protein [Bordetella genomosp. 4]|uniref:Protein kinase domain-containing protein n=1 Tax=Bordetella genomosp. 4 TaxID=463044 RepID=A0A261V095_9BORD|nr:hypothetical protein [Bordetella genomosp. 4]OZI41622.1 hypothetical protein CAL21_22860 [Bordetella genomosp. 4]OZI67549.1 hypothetical protein CAL20_00425 [Bordetella genomosp. 4]